MSAPRSKTILTKAEMLRIFKQVEAALHKTKTSITVSMLGGAAIVLYGIRDRATLDLDIANTKDSLHFQKICTHLDIPVDIVTVSSTVDFTHEADHILFEGHHLTVRGVNPEALIKLKLERFYKQDPEDIYAIVDYLSLSYKRFSDLVAEMTIDFIGNPRTLLLSALIVVEQIYPDHVQEFHNRFRMA